MKSLYQCFPRTSMEAIREWQIHNWMEQWWQYITVHLFFSSAQSCRVSKQINRCFCEKYCVFPTYTLSATTTINTNIRVSMYLKFVRVHRYSNNIIGKELSEGPCECGIEPTGSISHVVSYYQHYVQTKLYLLLIAPKGTTPVNQTSATDWQIVERRDNVISITLRKV